MKRLAGAALLALALTPAACAAPTDIVPRGSALLDAFATLARAGVLAPTSHPADFLGEPLHTRAELARLLERARAADPDRYARAGDMADTRAALITATADLAPELRADGVDLTDVRQPSGDTAPAAVSGYVQPEARVRDKGGSGVNGVYRATALGAPAANLRYVVSFSNWPEDWRRAFDRDIGPHDFPALNEAYLEVAGGRGLTVDVGRLYNRWGPGYRGATMLSDNAPAMDQLKVAFPFSLGARLGRDWRFTQMAATWRNSTDTRIYYEARRFEYAFSPRLSAEFAEDFISSRSKSLLVGFLPDFYSGQQIHLRPTNIAITDLDPYYNSALNFGLAYDAGDPFRIYGQFLIDDLRTPGKRSGTTPRKIAYLVGAAFRPWEGSQIVAEYNFADPTTYSSRNPDTQFQQGRFDQIGLPGGPNTREVFLRLEQRLTPQLSIAVQGRDRRRHDDSFPAPTSQTLGATATLRLDARSSVGATFWDYRQDPFPIPPDVPVGNGFQPTNAEGNYGQRIRDRELDLSYQFFF